MEKINIPPQDAPANIGERVERIIEAGYAIGAFRPTETGLVNNFRERLFFRATEKDLRKFEESFGV